MSVSLHKKKVRGHSYWYARECQRVGGKPKIVWQKYLGRAEDIATACGAPSKPPAPKEEKVSLKLWLPFATSPHSGFRRSR